MKYLFLTGILAFLSVSCSKKENSEIQQDSGNLPSPVVKNVSGQTLMESSDCMSCHNINEKMIGPSYQEIAAKYSDKDIEKLASKIIEGGSGVWGEIPMAPHSQFSKDDAKKMVEYILSLKK
ncbi:c-type cytochrome [Chryseobacterium sp. RR2-3-20]|uniref:c-type cytochrome n=1 Tax=Chryseobacterium sp. RR2-3-20 TaxID=2787626 RepID=UPI001AE0B719|nr:c-type cytochrome [Chryseobacterium sp. RR2-3-20]